MIQQIKQSLLQMSVADELEAVLIQFANLIAHGNKSLTDTVKREKGTRVRTGSQTFNCIKKPTLN